MNFTQIIYWLVGSQEILTPTLHDIFRATIIQITYCAPAWSGFCSTADRMRLDPFLSRCKRFGSTDNNLPSVESLFDDTDDTFSIATKGNKRQKKQ